MNNVLSDLEPVGRFCSAENLKLFFVLFCFCHWPTSRAQWRDARELNLSTIACGLFFLLLLSHSTFVFDCYGRKQWKRIISSHSVFPSNGLIEVPFIVPRVPFVCNRWPVVATYIYFHLSSCFAFRFYDAQTHSFVGMVIKIKFD